jgi:hypothetical protein
MSFFFSRAEVPSRSAASISHTRPGQDSTGDELEKVTNQAIGVSIVLPG